MPPPPHAKTLPLSREDSARVHFDLAEEERRELAAQPESQRTAAAYQKVIDTYRLVYRADPSNPKAPAAMAAVGALMTESGRQFADKKASKSAVDAYEYLRKQYPSSGLRERALLDEAYVYGRDLNDPATARQKYEEFLKTYPKSDLTDEAHRGLAALPAPETKTATPVAASKDHSRPASKAVETRAAGADQPSDSARVVAVPTPSAAPAETSAPRVDVPAAPTTISATATPEQTGGAAMVPAVQKISPPEKHDRLEVTAIRHWTTPEATHVAIDLDGDVRYDAGRASNPDRIFFDLHGAHLAGTLPGHNAAVQGDALLKNIRFAQYTLDTVRVVLDINAKADYTARLMTDPYRLIIEVHAKPGSAPALEVAGASKAADTPAKTVAATAKAHGGKPASDTAPPATAVNAPPPTGSVTVPTATPSPGTSAKSEPAPVTASTTAANPAPMPAEKATQPDAVVTAKSGKPARPRKGTKPSPDAPKNTAQDIPPATQEPPHETGVSQPPSDVSVTPDEDSTAAQRTDQNRSAPAPAPARQPEATSAASSLQDAAAAATADTGATSSANTSPPAPSVAPPAAIPSNSANPPASEDVPLSPGNSLAKPIAATHKGKASGSFSGPGLDPALQVHEAKAASDGQRSLVRALGLKVGRIVIDPGHGGHDNGTVGPDGLAEKDLVLDVSLRLGKLLQEKLGAQVTYTRTTDEFVPLETRTAIANQASADLFLSIHANSSPDHSARGVETYYLNFTSSPESMEVASRENAVSAESVHQLQTLVSEITLKDKADESREFAADVEHSLWSGVGPGNPALKDRGVKKAPFIVLIGANMPSVLTEISFVTNPRDAKLLRQPAYRERIATALYAGIARYVSGLSSVRIAQADTRKGN